MWNVVIKATVIFIGVFKENYVVQLKNVNCYIVHLLSVIYQFERSFAKL